MKWITIVWLFCCNIAYSQDFIPLWPEGKMPGSKGLKLNDSIANERIFVVGKPGMYAFFPSAQENTGAAMLVCPGGGYERLAYIVSGLQIAKWLNSIGVAAFVLNYRLPNSPDLQQRETAPLQDAQRAMKIIRANAIKWHIQRDKIGIQGSSAGGHLAALIGTSVTDIAVIKDALDTISFRPDFMMLLSPVIDLGKYAHEGSRNNLLGKNASKELVEQYSPYLHVTERSAPAFIVHASNDKSVDPHNSILMYQSLLEHSVPSSLHIFPQGAHAITLHNNPGSTDLWTNLFEAWLKEMKFINDVQQ
jgi:acetyl esterase/lipase